MGGCGWVGESEHRPDPQPHPHTLTLRKFCETDFEPHITVIQPHVVSAGIQ
jgi:hypothetical protein